MSKIILWMRLNTSMKIGSSDSRSAEGRSRPKVTTGQEHIVGGDIVDRTGTFFYKWELRQAKRV